MTDTATPVVCGHCGTPATRALFGHPWCQQCAVWLVPDHTGTQWVSFAEAAHRQQAADTAAAITAAAAQVADAIDLLRQQLPPGWELATRQFPGAPHQITVVPPPGTVDATAYLTPPTGGHGWTVRIHNRRQGVDYPLYEDGGKRAAAYDSAQAALHAAIEAVRADVTTGATPGT